ncbi:MAG: Holliday junction resolvase RuvX [Chloroflexota bacterium]
MDPGERRVGVALSDPTRLLSSPLKIITVRSRAQAVAEVAALVAPHAVAEIVVGHPRNTSGEIGPQARRAEALAHELGRLVDVPVRLWDERYSTIEATALVGSRRGGRRGDRQRLDDVAAAVMLQTYLDAHR